MPPTAPCWGAGSLAIPASTTLFTRFLASSCGSSVTRLCRRRDMRKKRELLKSRLPTIFPANISCIRLGRSFQARFAKVTVICWQAVTNPAWGLPQRMGYSPLPFAAFQPVFSIFRRIGRLKSQSGQSSASLRRTALCNKSFSMSLRTKIWQSIKNCLTTEYSGSCAPMDRRAYAGNSKG